MKLKEVHLSTLLTQIKDKISLDNYASYRLVTISKTGDIKLREVVKGSLIKSNSAFRIKSNSFIYSRLAIESGAYGIVPQDLDGSIVTSEMPSFNISEKILPEFLLYSLQLPFFKFQMKQLTKGVGRTRVKEKSFLTFKIQLPDIAHQAVILNTLKTSSALHDNLTEEIDLQNQLLTQLKQSILSQAIQGKLTADWRKQNPNTEPANELLKRIKAEKEQFIKHKKIKKEKALPTIAEDEIPFNLPSGWAWARPQDVCISIVDCPHSTPKFENTGMLCIDSNCINIEGELILNKIRKVSSTSFIQRNSRLTPKSGDIIYVREGIIGKNIVIPKDYKVCLGQRVMLFRPFIGINSYYFRHLVSSKFFLKSVEEKHKGMGAKHINMSDLRSLPIPIPPIEEQKIILQKIDTLMIKYMALKQEIKTSEANAQMLMQAVLKEAFEVKKEEVEA